MAKGFDVKNNMAVKALAKKLNMEVGMSTSMAVEEAMTYLTMSFHKRNVDSIKAAELLRWWLSDFQDKELEYFETRVDLAKQVRKNKEEVWHTDGRVPYQIGEIKE